MIKSCAQIFTLFFPLCFPFELWWFLCYGFFLQLHFMLILLHFYGLFCHYFSVIFPWKVRNLLLYFSSHFNEFFLFNLFRWNVSFSCPFYLVDLFVYLFVIIRLFIRIFPYFYFVISVSYLSSCLAVLIYLFIFLFMFLLNCANSVLCAV